jgi:hypothetical protein
MKPIIITTEALAAIKLFGPRVVIDNTERLTDGTHQLHVEDALCDALHTDKHHSETISDYIIRTVARLTNRLN